ncbi:MAG: D-2-hydroxyacid dehydrogenase [Microlunatus sp.]|nr:D-2-hydroxyacid dehydrogenase [Microlunatus sp.]
MAPRPQPDAGSAAAGASRPVVVVLSTPEHAEPDGLEELRSAVDFRYTDADGLPGALAGADALLLWDFFSDALARAWPYADRLRWVHVAAAGVDRLMFPELAASDVVVTNAQGIFDEPIAEFVLASILAFVKDLDRSRRRQRERIWQHRETLRLAGRHALVVGTGGIGRATARLLTAVGMEVRGIGRRARESDPDFGRVVASTDLVECAGWADHLVIAAPLTDQTRGLIGTDVLMALPAHAQLVNIARGPIVDEDALLAALRRGGLAGAALDVFATEPLPADHPFWDIPEVAVSPHMSGDVVGWRSALAEQFRGICWRWVRGESLPNVVDTHRGYVPGEPPRREAVAVQGPRLNGNR